MPKITFQNLEETKKQAFINASLKEFAHHNFEQASITKIVKELKIAKGSVYQYFDDKMDLWLFLKEYAEKMKMKYVFGVERSGYRDFWDYYLALYKAGVVFDLEEALCSLFLYQISKESHPECKKYLESWNKMADEVMQKMIRYEQKLGAFRKDVPVKIMSYHLRTVSQSIGPLVREHFNIDFDQNIADGKPLFAGNKKSLMKAVKQLIKLLESALKPQ